MFVNLFRHQYEFRRAMRTVLLCVVLGGLAACQAVYRNHGHVPSSEDLAAISVGVDTRASVTDSIGAPTASGVLNESGFYYVTSRIRHYGAARPRVVSRSLVAISFDRRGVVSNVERFGLENGRLVALERRVTSSSVENKTFMRQLLGNLGNFDPSSFLQ